MEVNLTMLVQLEELQPHPHVTIARRPPVLQTNHAQWMENVPDLLVTEGEDVGVRDLNHFL